MKTEQKEKKVGEETGLDLKREQMERNRVKQNGLDLKRKQIFKGLENEEFTFNR